jgi:excisionase family DNA binding protein
MANELLSTTEAAEHLGVHINTIRRWIKDGDLQAVRLNKRRFRIRLSDLNAMLKGQADATR